MLCLPPERVAAPTQLPIELADAKAHLRVDDVESDALITAAIEGVTAHLDGYGGILGRAIITQRWREYRPFWPASRSAELTLAPVASIVSIVARKPDGSSLTLDPASYRLLAGASRPTVLFGLAVDLPGLDCAPDAVAITYEAGYGAPADLPGSLRSAMLLMIGDLYRFTESAGAGALSAIPVSTSADRLLASFRRNLV